MKLELTLRYTSKLCCFVFAAQLLFAQKKVESKKPITDKDIAVMAKKDSTANDSTEVEPRKVAFKHSIRLGADISKPVITMFNSSYSGLELVGDFRLSNMIYLAGEYGTEKSSAKEASFSYFSKGSYFKLGFDANFFSRKYNMEHMVYLGVRYGYSVFNQSIQEYSIFNKNQYWGEGTKKGTDKAIIGSQPDTSLQWLAYIFGIKMEVFSNFYMGASIFFNQIIAEKEGKNVLNLWAPGFGKKVNQNIFSVGFNYTISYRIPLFKGRNYDAILKENALLDASKD